MSTYGIASLVIVATVAGSIVIWDHMKGGAAGKWIYALIFLLPFIIGAIYWWDLRPDIAIWQYAALIAAIASLAVIVWRFAYKR